MFVVRIFLLFFISVSASSPSLLSLVQCHSPPTFPWNNITATARRVWIACGARIQTLWLDLGARTMRGLDRGRRYVAATHSLR